MAAQIDPKQIPGLHPNALRERKPEEYRLLLPEHWPEDEAQQAQLTRELTAWLAGYDRAKAAWDKAQRDGDPLRAAPVRKLIEEWCQPIAAEIERVASTRKRAKGGPKPIWMRYYEILGAHNMAYCALDALMSALMPKQLQAQEIKATAMSASIGTHIAMRAAIAEWQRLKPALYDAYIRRLKTAGATTKHAELVLSIGLRNKARQKHETDTEDAHRAFLEATELPPRHDRIVFGRWLLLLIERTTKGAVKLVRRGKKTKGVILRAYHVMLSEEARMWITEAMEQLALHSTHQKPMICRPKRWNGPRGGGFLMGLRSRLVSGKGIQRKRAEGGLDRERAADHLSAVNWLQGVPFRVRREVWEAASEANAKGIKLKCLPISEIEEVPPRPHTEDKGELAAWRRKAAAIERDNAGRISTAASTTLMFRDAEELLDEPEIYFPCTADFRGRMYSASSTLDPQGSDLARSMVHFARGKPIGDGDGPGWLAAQVAKAYGQDKLPWRERIQWTYDNTDMLVAIAMDPLGQRQVWEGKADKLWAALAAAKEWHGYINEGAGFVTTLPCYIDGTCNGLQHFAALAQNTSLAKLVNLEPGDAPQDVYQAVADALLTKIIEQSEAGDPVNRRAASLWLRVIGRDKAPRSLAKKVVMVKPYGGSHKTTIDEIYAYLNEVDPKRLEWGGDVSDVEEPKLVGWLSTRLKNALGSRTYAADRIMEWLQESVKLMIDSGIVEGAKWITPSGWPWRNIYLGDRIVRRFFGTSGRNRSEIILHDENTAEPHAKNQRNGVSPNFVHALDASSLVFAIETMKANNVMDITCIHDSVGGLAPDMSIIAKAVRMGFVEVHESNPLESYRDAVLEALEGKPKAQGKLRPLPKKGEFDVRRVLDSEYFFC